MTGWRSECPVHWSAGMTMFPDEGGYWSVTNADGVKDASMDWQTIKALFQRGFTPKRINEHEDEIRAITRDA